MKFIIILAFMLEVTVGEPVIRTWTLYELLTIKSADLKVQSEFTPYLNEATSELMNNFWLEEIKPSLHALLRSPSGKTTWTTEELLNEANEKNIKTELKVPGLLQAKSQARKNRDSGKSEDNIEVEVSVIDVSIWKLTDLDEAIQFKKYTNSYTQSLPYLEKARGELTKQNLEKIAVITPYGLLISQSGHTELVPKKNYN